jgi:hypothetical protein
VSETFSLACESELIASISWTAEDIAKEADYFPRITTELKRPRWCGAAESGSTSATCAAKLGSRERVRERVHVDVPSSPSPNQGCRQRLRLSVVNAPIESAARPNRSPATPSPVRGEVSPDLCVSAESVKTQQSQHLCRP